MADIIDCDPEISLESLPAELITQISGHLSGGDHQNLLQVSKRLKDNCIETLYQTRVFTVHNNYVRGNYSKRCELESLDKSISRSIPMTNGRVGPLGCKIKNLDVEITDKNCVTGWNKPMKWMPIFDASVPREICAITIRHDGQNPMQETKKGIAEFMRNFHHFKEVTMKFRFLHERHPNHDVARESRIKAFNDFKHELEAALGPSKLDEDVEVTMMYLSWKPLENNRARARKNQERQSGREIRGSERKGGKHCFMNLLHLLAEA